MEIKLKVEDDDNKLIHVTEALRIAKRFHKEWPDRIGFGQGVVYTMKCTCSKEDHSLAFYVYRTPKGMIVCRSC